MPAPAYDTNTFIELEARSSPDYLESQLLELLIQTSPEIAQAPVLAPAETAQPKLAGPVVDPENTADVVTSQSQVDDLLASLGF